MTDLKDRDVRQRALVPPERLGQHAAVVVGVGAIGRQVALQLASIGIPYLHLWDFDTVDVENLAVQGFPEADLGMLKVTSVANSAQELSSSLRVRVEPHRFRASGLRDVLEGMSVALFCCVDSIETRRHIWNSTRGAIPFFVDGRMSAEVIRVLASDKPGIDTDYEKTLFGSEEAFAGSCTAKSTLYSSNIAAGMMVAQFAHYLRKIEVVKDQIFNLLSAELTVAE